MFRAFGCAYSYRFDSFGSAADKSCSKVGRTYFKKACKPSAETVIYYSSECECFEAAVSCLVKSSAARAFDLRIRVVDTEKTDQSRKYLAALRNKLKIEFEIE